MSYDALVTFSFLFLIVVLAIAILILAKDIWTSDVKGRKFLSILTGSTTIPLVILFYIILKVGEWI